MSEHEIVDILGFCPKDSDGNPLIMFSTNNFEGTDFNFSVYNFKVRVCDKNGLVVQNKKQAHYLTDDQTYQTHPEIHKLIPRGLSVLYVKDKKDNSLVFKKTTQGFFKFSALSSIDEDDEVNCDFMDKTEIKNCDQVLITEKANGKLFLLSSFKINDKYYFVGGSKNNHVIVPVNELGYEQLDTYYSLVRDMFSVWLKEFYGLSLQSRNEILAKLETNTFSGEFEDGKHLVPVEKKQIRWFGMMPNITTEFVNTDILKCLNWFSSKGLLTIQYSMKTNEEFWQNYSDGRTQRNSEGSVRHFLKNGNSIGIEKFKTYWYIVIRMLRQIMMRCKTVTQSKEQVHLTLIKRNQLLQFNRIQFNFAKKLCELFIDWFESKGLDRKEVGIDETCMGMGNAWKQFILETGTNDDFGNMSLEEASEQYISKNKLLVIVQGIPGLGKNSIGEAVASLNPKWVSIDQDSFKGKKAGELCFKRFKSLITSDAYDVVLLLRNNSNMSHYGKYALFAKEQHWKTVALYPKEIISNPAKLIATCMNTVVHRTSHVFDKLDNATRIKLVLVFYSQFEMPVQNDLIDFVDDIQWLNNTDIDNSVNKEYLWEWFNTIKSVRDGFSSPNKDYLELQQNLLVDSLNHLQYRLDKQTIIEEFVFKINKHISADIDLKVFTTEPNFVSIKIDPETKQYLSELIESHCNTNGKSKYLDHLTLMHASDKHKDNNLWDKVKNLCGESIMVTVNKLYYGDGIVLGADLLYKGNAFNHMVYSQVPHITSFLPKTMKPYQSINFIKDSQYTNSIDVDYEFEGVVYLN